MRRQAARLKSQKSSGKMPVAATSGASLSRAILYPVLVVVVSTTSMSRRVLNRRSSGSTAPSSPTETAWIQMRFTPGVLGGVTMRPNRCENPSE